MPARLAKHPSDYVILLMIALWMRDDTPEPLPVLVSRFIEETPYKRITIVRSLNRLEEEGIIRLQKQSQRYDTGYDISLVDDDILAVIEVSLTQTIRVIPSKWQRVNSSLERSSGSLPYAPCPPDCSS